MIAGRPVNAESLKNNAEALTLIRRASALPFAVSTPAHARDDDSPRSPLQRNFSDIVAFSAEQRLARDDLDGAWEDILVLLRMGRQLSGPVTAIDVLEGLAIEGKALGLAIRRRSPRTRPPNAWPPHSTPIVPRRSRCPPWPKPSGPRPGSPTVPSHSPRPNWHSHRPATYGHIDGRQGAPAIQGHHHDDPVGEAARAGPASCGRSTTAASSRSPLSTPMPGLKHRDIRGPTSPLRASPWRSSNISEPLTRILLSPIESLITMNDSNEVVRRAFVQILALRSWQIAHDGRLPDRLDELVPLVAHPAPERPLLRKPVPLHHLPGAVRVRPGRPRPAGQRKAETTCTKRSGNASSTASAPMASTTGWRAAGRPGFGTPDIVFPIPGNTTPRPDQTRRTHDWSRSTGAQVTAERSRRERAPGIAGEDLGDGVDGGVELVVAGVEVGREADRRRRAGSRRGCPGPSGPSETS